MGNPNWSTTFNPITAAVMRAIQVGVRKFNLAHIMELILSLSYVTMKCSVNDAGATDTPASGYPGSGGRLYNHTVAFMGYPCKVRTAFWCPTLKNEGASISDGWGILYALDDDGNVTYLSNWFALGQTEGYEIDLLAEDLPAGSVIFFGAQVENTKVANGELIAIISPTGTPME